MGNPKCKIQRRRCRLVFWCNFLKAFVMTNYHCCLLTSGLKIGHRESLQLYVTCSSGFHSLVLSHIAQGWRTDTWNDSSICNENLLDNQGTNNLHTYTKVVLYIHKHEWWRTNVYYTRVRLIYTPFAGNRTIRLNKNLH